MGLALTIHSSEYPAANRDKLRTGLRNGRVPQRCLYESLAQASRWLAYAQAWAPIHRDERVSDLYENAFMAAAESCDASRIRYFGLGCGDGAKDLRALSLLRRRGRRMQAHLVDASPSLLVEACLRNAAFDPKPTAADLDRAPALRDLGGGEGEGATLGSCLGMLPTLGSARLLPYLAGLIDDQSALVLSANLSATDERKDRLRVAAQYDTPLALDWYRGFLIDLGVPAAAFQLAVRTELDPTRPGVYQIIAEAAFARETRIALYGDSFRFGRDRSLRLFQSERLTPEAIRRLAARNGLELKSSFESMEAEEGVYLLSRTAEEGARPDMDAAS